MKIEMKGGNLVVRRHPRTKLQNKKKDPPALTLGAKRNRSAKWLIMYGLFLIFCLISAFSLRANNLNMVAYRDKLSAADKTNDVAQVQLAARDLQRYVSHHMNTSTGKIALQTLYNSAAKQALEKSRPPEIDQNLYNEAASQCQAQLINYGYEAWATCVAGRVGINNTAAVNAADASAPDPDLYYAEYAPAVWSFDLAGVSLAITVLLAIVVGVRFFFWFIEYLIAFWRKHFAKQA